MDTSETYIKMCDCPEIQDIAKWEHGDWFWPEPWGSALLLDRRREDTEYPNHYKFYSTMHGGPWTTDFKVLWLPRQDQLQKMAFPCPDDTINVQANRIVNQFALEAYESGHYATYFFPTWEQLWLAFVMKERYHKHWSGEEWVDE